MHLLFRFAPRAARTCTQRVYRSSGFDAFVIATRRERERERRRDRIAAASEETTPLIICMSRLVTGRVMATTGTFRSPRKNTEITIDESESEVSRRLRSFRFIREKSSFYQFPSIHPSRIKEKGKRKIVVLEPRAPAAMWPPATLRCLNV